MLQGIGGSSRVRTGRRPAIFDSVYWRGLCLLLAFVILWVDSLTPLGFADGSLYLFPLMLAGLGSSEGFLIGFAVLASLFTIAGFFTVAAGHCARLRRSPTARCRSSRLPCSARRPSCSNASWSRRRSSHAPAALTEPDRRATQTADHRRRHRAHGRLAPHVWRREAGVVRLHLPATGRASRLCANDGGSQRVLRARMARHCPRRNAQRHS